MIRARRRGAGGEDGEKDRGQTAIEFVLFTPILFFLMFAAVQFALYLFAAHIAQAAAQAGARVARSEDFKNQGGWHGDAQTKVNDYIGTLGPGLINGPGMTPIDRHLVGGVATVGVTVTGQAVKIFPWITINITATSEGPVECITNVNGTCQ